MITRNQVIPLLMKSDAVMKKRRETHSSRVIEHSSVMNVWKQKQVNHNLRFTTKFVTQQFHTKPINAKTVENKLDNIKNKIKQFCLTGVKLLTK